MNYILLAVGLLMAAIFIFPVIELLQAVLEALFATSQEIARAYPIPTFIACFASVGMTLYFAIAKR